MKLRTSLSVATILLTFLAGPTANAKSICKSLSKTACGQSNSCSLTKGYTTKKGITVTSYCRNKPGQAASKKPKSAKTKVSNQKTVSSKIKS